MRASLIIQRWLFAWLLTIIGFAAHSQVAFNTTATPDVDAGTTTLSTSINPTGTNRAVVIGVFGEGQTANPTITYGAQTPTLLERNDASDPGVWLYYVLPVGSGSQTISVTFGASCGRCALGAVSYTGVNQSSPVGTATVGLSSSATTHSTNVSSGAGQMVVDVALVGWPDIAVGAGQTARVDQDDFLSVFRSFGMSDEAGATTTTMSWTTSSAADDGTVIAVPLLPAAAGGTGIILKRRKH